ncbi:Pentatricopeptide repeat-containing protein 1 [Melipona quadrifasciata]|uniref:Pentatricopeptide repeat-containing protein 1 n=1 Tax=Melipona quadrifasciata TaxID=166423 RepID=A0A0N0BIT7_9HYME|nr:Pentatricopeptide repeat-containing protein 1 [Melipona quadrifasciata]
MDEVEKREEKFMENVLPKRQRFTYIQYVKLIKSHLCNKNLQLALNVLTVMKENRDKPDLYIYRLLISAFAQQGDVKQCFKLFKKLRERGFIPTPTVYSSLMHACAESKDTETALKYLTFLREHFYVKKINLTDINYAALIRAYNQHKQTLLAFEIADEAKDKGIYTQDIIAALFNGVINDTENGLKHCLVLWHKMKVSEIKPTIFHYNLLLRAIRDTKFGDLKVNDILVPELINTKIQFIETGRPDLLDSPPVLTTSLISLLKKHNYFISNESSKQRKELDTIDKNSLLSLKLNNILQENRLLLFGGVDKLLKRMKDDDVQPDVKTITLLLDLIPSTIEAEEVFFKYIVKNKLQIDISFFNMLIKRRCLRKRYKDATKVIDKMQTYHMTPNIVTFGVLAIGCRMEKDGRELLEQLDTIRCAPNYVILGTLLFNACSTRNFSYALFLMQYILKNQIRPSQDMLNNLEKFDRIMLEIVRNKDKYKHKAINKIMEDYNDFKIKYEDWKTKVQNDILKI